MHGPDSGLLEAVAQKSKAILQEHLRDDNVLVGDVQEHREPEEESMSPCALDGKFGDVEGTCSPRKSPMIAHIPQAKGDSVGLLTPPQPILPLTPQNTPKQ